MTEPLLSTTFTTVLSVGLVVDGHGHDPDAITAAAKAYLGARGVNRLLAHNLVTAPRAIQEAWWGGDDVGFVQDTHPAATPITVVNLPPDLVAILVDIDG